MCSCGQVMTAVERHIDWDIVKCLVLAGPGFVKDDFKKHLEEEAVRRDLRYLKMTFPSPTPH